MAASKSKSKYTKPKLRKEIKEDLQSSDKGGKPGQWSARKSQMLVQEYEKKGGGYTSKSKDSEAKSLERWTDQDWQTIDGEADARDGRTTQRYLPKAVWAKLSAEERREAERTKTTRSRAGKQHVPWTDAIKRAFDELEGGGPTSGSSVGDDGESREQLYAQAKELGISGRSKMTKAQLREAIRSAS